MREINSAICIEIIVCNHPSCLWIRYICTYHFIESSWQPCTCK